MCLHQPACPPFEDSAHDAAKVISAHPEQGWSLLCNGVILFEDGGEILPSGFSIPAQRHSKKASVLEV